MKDTLRLIFVLTITCLAAGLGLAQVNNMTKDRIAEAKLQRKLTALKKVLPPADNKPIDNIQTVMVNDVEWSFYVATKNGAIAGAAFETSTREGYGDLIKVLVGVNADGKVQAIEILDQKETPGLGAKIATPDFRRQFGGNMVTPNEWCQVQKDGGTVVAITGATISSRAVSKAVRAGLDAYGRLTQE
jgi:electron transport complex protein RnfG